MLLTSPDKGWSWVVMVASFAAHVISGCFLYAVGVIHVAILDRFSEDVTTTSWAGGIHLFLLSFAGIISSSLINRYSCRVAMVIGGLLMTTGLVMTAFLPSLNWVIFSYGVVAGTGAGICYSAHVIVLGYNFLHRRNVAGGLAVSGCGVGTLVFAPILELAREAYGNSGFFFILAGLALHHVLFGTLFFPSELEVQSKFVQPVNKEDKVIYEKNLKDAILRVCRKYFRVLTFPAFLCLCLSMFLANIGIFLAFLHFPRVAIETGSSPREASFFLSMNGLCSCFARVLGGMAANADNIDDVLIYSGPFAALGLSTVLFPLYMYSYAGKAAFAMILGLYNGVCYSVLNSLVVRFLGLQDLATGFGYVMTFTGVGCLIGPVLAGIIVDGGGTYAQSFLTAGFVLILSAMLGLATSCFHTPETKVLGAHEDVEKTYESPQEEEPANTDSLL